MFYQSSYKHDSFCKSNRKGSKVKTCLNIIVKDLQHYQQHNYTELDIPLNNISIIFHNYDHMIQFGIYSRLVTGCPQCG